MSDLLPLRDVIARKAAMQLPEAGELVHGFVVELSELCVLGLLH